MDPKDELSRIKEMRRSIVSFIGSDFGSGLDISNISSVSSFFNFFEKIHNNENPGYIIEESINSEDDEYILTTLLSKSFKLQNFLLSDIYCISTEKGLNRIIKIMDSMCLSESTIDDFFILACKRNKTSFVRHQIKQGFDVNKRYSKGNTALHIASKFNSVDVIKELIQNGADKESRNDDNCTPLIVAVYSCKEESSILLIQEGCDINATDYIKNFLIHVASKNRLYNELKSETIRF